MKNKEFKFKTNINCEGCVSQIKDDLNNAEGICHWSVDTDDKDKTLTVMSTTITQDEVIAVVQNKGYKAEPLNC
ncbi:MAG TPA: heavy-metal-associated domain-containing protein [Sphingobacterium sp.]|nr:heavy-metal-associated domain-containing protein [Sphingobacterium sp.]